MLYLFDIDGTLIRSFMREGGGGASQAYDLVEVLPGRRERIEALRGRGHHVALVTNQGGVAFGYQTLDQVLDKMGRVLVALGLSDEPAGFPFCIGSSADIRPRLLYMSLGHPNARIPLWRNVGYDDWRKPGGGMLRKAMADHAHPPDLTVFVGDMDSDRLAAEHAGVPYSDAESFFGV
jgi:HAD superfamily hydrolase (TIGR01662 family)